MEIYGLPKEYKPLVLDKFFRKSAPPEAVTAYNAAMLRRLAQLPSHAKVIEKPKGFLAVSMPSTKSPLVATAHHSTEGPTMPTPTPASKLPSKRPHVPQPRVVAPNLKAFKNVQDAYGAGMAMLAALGRYQEPRNYIAEQYCNERNMPVLNVATIAQPTSGGYLVPDALSEAIIKNMARIGAARRLSMFAPMNSLHLAIPIERGGVEVEYINELGAGSGQDITWGNVVMGATKRGVLGYVSQELADDALVRYVDTFADRAAHALARREDKEFVLADGTSTYGGEVGLIHSLGAGGLFTATGHDAWEDLTVADFTGAMAKLPEQYADGRESWICSAAFHAMGMLRAAGGASQGFAEDGRPLFLSKPVNVLPTMPAASAASQVCCLYGNFAEAAVFGDRGLVFTLSDKCPSAFEYDRIAMRCTSRYDINVHNGGDANNAGAYVGLKTDASS